MRMYLGTFRVPIVFKKIRLPDPFFLGASEEKAYWSLTNSENVIFFHLFPTDYRKIREKMPTDTYGFVDLEGKWVMLPDSFLNYAKTKKAREVFVVGLGNHIAVMVPFDYRKVFSDISKGLF